MGHAVPSRVAGGTGRLAAESIAVKVLSGARVANGHAVVLGAFEGHTATVEAVRGGTSVKFGSVQWERALISVRQMLLFQFFQLSRNVGSASHRGVSVTRYVFGSS